MRQVILLTLIMLTQSAYAQTGNRYWIEFTDKNNTPFSLSNPAAYLSQRSIDRRTRQGIAVDSTDIPVNSWYLDSLVAKGATLRHHSKWLNGATIEVPSPSVLQAINNLPFVKSTRNNGRVGYTRDPLFEDKLQLPADGQALRVQRLTNASYGVSYNQIRLHHGDVLHNLGYMGQGMYIAVFDAGFINTNILPCFDSLYLGNRVIDTYDYVDLSTNVYGFDSHGTYVLGCMAGVIPGELIGTAPAASYLLYRTENNVGGSENQIEEDNWVAAAERADSIGADVFNTSLSYTTFDNAAMNYTYADMDGNTARITRASDYAAQKGILVVASAGNYGNGGWTYIGAPADGDSVLSVGATGADGNRVGFSSIGPTSDGRIKPNVMAQGSGAVTCQLSGQGVTFVNGTSFSGPIMAGLAAILWQAHPNKSNMDIYNALQQSGNNASSPNNQVGYGLPNLQQALMSLGNKEMQQTAFIDVYPNPFNDVFSVNFNTQVGAQASLRMMDIQGRVVYEESLGWVISGPNAFKLSPPLNLPAGMYVLEIVSDYNRFISRIIKH
ncbi:MAG: S8 family serine peptidase [Bacteroidia bacterium]